jgi:hypothetical protein
MGTPRFQLVRQNEDIEGVNEVMQSRYRSGVGMLQYLTKHFRPDIVNAMRELSMYMDSAKMDAYKEILRVTKFVLDHIV